MTSDTGQVCHNYINVTDVMTNQDNVFSGIYAGRKKSILKSNVNTKQVPT